jgi:hypothetical protein
MINGDWLWVASVNNNPAKQGYIKWDAVLRPANAAPVAAAQAPQVASQPVQQANFQTQPGTTRSPSYNYGGQNYGNNYNGGGYYDDRPGMRAAQRSLDTQMDKLDRMENRNASNGAIRAQERRVQQQERRVERMGRGR